MPITMVQEADAVLLAEATAAEQHFQRRLASAKNRRERAHASAARPATLDARDEAQAGANETQLLHAARRVNCSPAVSAPAAEGGQVAEATGSIGRSMKSQLEQASKRLRGGDTEIENMELSRSDHVMTREQQQKHRDMQEEMLAIQQQRAGHAIHESNPDDVRRSLSSLSPWEWERVRKHSAALIRTPPHSPPHSKKKSPEDVPKNNSPLAAHTTDFFDRGEKAGGLKGGGVKEGEIAVPASSPLSFCPSSAPTPPPSSSSPLPCYQPQSLPQSSPLPIQS